jgi:hypothetical protein
LDFGAGTRTERHPLTAGVDAAVDGVDAGLLAEVVVVVELEALLPQPASPTTRAKVSHARRTADKQTRSRHREPP